jgi:hypothetical protein
MRKWWEFIIFFRNFKIEFERGSYYFSAKVVSSNPADGEVYSKKII